MREIIDALLNLPPTYGDHPTMKALVQFTLDGESFFTIDWIDDLGRGWRGRPTGAAGEDMKAEDHAESGRPSVFDARPIDKQLEEACCAVLNGVIWDGFNGPTGISTNEALGYATKLAVWVRLALAKDAAQIDGTSTTHFTIAEDGTVTQNVPLKSDHSDGEVAP